MITNFLLVVLPHVSVWIVCQNHYFPKCPSVSKNWNNISCIRQNRNTIFPPNVAPSFQFLRWNLLHYQHNTKFCLTPKVMILALIGRPRWMTSGLTPVAFIANLPPYICLCFLLGSPCSYKANISLLWPWTSGVTEGTLEEMIARFLAVS